MITSIPHLAALPLHCDARGIADRDPGAGRPGSIGGMAHGRCRAICMGRSNCRRRRRAARQARAAAGAVPTDRLVAKTVRLRNAYGAVKTALPILIRNRAILPGCLPALLKALFDRNLLLSRMASLRPLPVVRTFMPLLK